MTHNGKKAKLAFISGCPSDPPPAVPFSCAAAPFFQRPFPLASPTTPLFFLPSFLPSQFPTLPLLLQLACYLLLFINNGISSTCNICKKNWHSNRHGMIWDFIIWPTYSMPCHPSMIHHPSFLSLSCIYGTVITPWTQTPTKTRPSPYSIPLSLLYYYYSLTNYPFIQSMNEWNPSSLHLFFFLSFWT